MFAAIGTKGTGAICVPLVYILLHLAKTSTIADFNGLMAMSEALMPVYCYDIWPIVANDSLWLFPQGTIPFSIDLSDVWSINPGGV